MCILKHVEDVEDRLSTLKGYNAMYVKDVEDGKRTYTHIFVQWISNLKKVLESWDLGLSNHTIKSYVCWSMSKMSKMHAACSLQNNVKDVDIKTSHNRFLTDFIEFISFLSKMSKMCTNYNVDSNMKSSNYMKIRFKALIYFELQHTSN